MSRIVITGANRGIGLQLARQFCERGDDVFALCRKSSSELKALQVQVIECVDVTDEKCLQKVAEQIGAVDVLLNNAGILIHDELDDLDFSGIMEQFQVNALGPLKVSSAFLPYLHEGSKIAMVTSRMGSIDDNGSGGYYGYRMSKVALNMGATSLAKDLQSKGIAVIILHPGYVKTDMTRHMGQISPEESAKGLIREIDELTIDTTGIFKHTNGEELPW